MKSEVVPIRMVNEDTFFIEMIDQKELPQNEIWVACKTVEDVADAIRSMVVRGAPAIGIAAAYGVLFAIRDHGKESFDKYARLLGQTRPTAVNLFWAIDRMKTVVEDYEGRDLAGRLKVEADLIFEEDRENNLRMGDQAQSLFTKPSNILTHCNTGGLATGGFGTALGIIRAVHHAGNLKKVWVDETRPYLQGARLTAWECMKDDIPSTLITDNMAGYFMQKGEVDAVIVGTDRVAANGDVANKIGTYSLAVLCKFHNIPFYVAAPVSTIDPNTPTGKEIVIEQRSSEEVTHVSGKSIAPEGVKVSHPAFDVTPGNLVTAIITEDGIFTSPYAF